MARVSIRTPTRPLLHDAAKRGDVAQLLRALDQVGRDEIDQRQLGYAAIHLAAKGGHAEALELLLESGACVAARASDGATPLHCAAEMNRTHIIAILLARGAALQGAPKTECGDSVLHFSALNGRLGATKLLVARGADVHATNAHGCTPHDDAVQLGRGRCPCEDPTAREWGAVAAFLAHVMPMAPAERVAFAQRAWDRPAAAMLHDAAEMGDLARLGQLLASGSDVDAVDVDGSTPIHAAVEGAQLGALAMLLSARANVRATNHYGDSALHVAAREGRRNLTQLLVSRGADVHATNRFGVTPLALAERRKAREWEGVVALLREEMAELVDLPPAARALRKVRAAALVQQQQQQQQQQLHGPQLAKVAPRAAADDVTAAPVHHGERPMSTARGRTRQPLSHRPGGGASSAEPPAGGPTAEGQHRPSPHTNSIDID